MKKFFLFPLVLCLGLVVACNNDDDDATPEIEYNIEIISPDDTDKKVGDEITLKVDFSEANDQTVHHVKVKIYNEMDNTVVFFEGPGEAHVHETDGAHTVEQTLTLDVDPHTDWIVEAKIWGHEAGAHEKVVTSKFHVHPN